MGGITSANGWRRSAFAASMSYCEPAAQRTFGSGRYDSYQEHPRTETAHNAKNAICAIETSLFGISTSAQNVFDTFATIAVYSCHDAQNVRAANREGGHGMS